MGRSGAMLGQSPIASPCLVAWERMSGTDTVRHGRECDLTVYNLLSMTRLEAETLLHESEEWLCVRLFRRTDGTVLTADCPVGRRGLRWRLARLVTTVLGLVTLPSCVTPSMGSIDVKRKDCGDAHESDRVSV